MATKKVSGATGKITQVISAVVDVQFELAVVVRLDQSEQVVPLVQW